ncbi:MAG: cytochrome c family protein [Syntrophobacteraceae bacterium]|nr:cytochrome c family protein [Syntrophobacteraceae bacterium]
MKHRKWLSYVFVTFVLVLAGAFAVVAADVKDELEIKAGLWATPTKAAVPFTHKKHAEEYKIPCADCHHVFKDGKNVWKEGDPVQKCEACHTNAEVQGEAKLPPELPGLPQEAEEGQTGHQGSHHLYRLPPR